MVLDTMSFTVTAPGAGAAMTPVTGDPASIRNGTPGKGIFLISAWTLCQVAGFTQFQWPSGHDLVRGYRYRNLLGTPTPKVPKLFPGSFRAQDPVAALQAGSAVAGDVELASLLVFYEDLPGVAGRLITMDTLRRRGTKITTYEDTMTPTAASVYSGARTIGQAANTFQANTDYALLGMHCGLAGALSIASLTVRGVDSGGLRVGIPFLTTQDGITGNWFAELAEMLDMPLIPVFNSANFGGTFIEGLANENLTAMPFSLVLVELAPTAKLAKESDAAQNAAVNKGSPNTDP